MYVKFSAHNYKNMEVQALRTYVVYVTKEKVRILILYIYLLYNNRMVIQIVSELYFNARLVEKSLIFRAVFCSIGFKVGKKFVYDFSKTL